MDVIYTKEWRATFAPLSATEKQMLLHYTVREANGTEYRVSIVWNKQNIKTRKTDYSAFSFKPNFERNWLMGSN